MTQRASWRERSASSRIKELAPRQTIETVEPAALCVTPVILTVREPNDWTSSISSADPSLSSVKESKSAIGLHPVDYFGRY